MATFNRRKTAAEEEQSEWYIVTRGTDHPNTYQVRPMGYRLLRDAGFRDGDSLERADVNLLRALDQLYTIGDSSSQADVSIPEEVAADQVPIDKRVAFAVQLVDRYDLRMLCDHEATIRFLTSFTQASPAGSDGDHAVIDPIVAQILADTPFEPAVVGKGDQYEAVTVYHGLDAPPRGPYNPILLALVLGVGYTELEPPDPDDITNSDPIWEYDDWLIWVSSNTVPAAIKHPLIEAVPDPLIQALSDDIEDSFDADTLDDFVECEIAGVMAYQAMLRVGDFNAALAKYLADGILSDTDRQILITRGAPEKREGAHNAVLSPYSGQLVGVY